PGVKTQYLKAGQFWMEAWSLRQICCRTLRGDSLLNDIEAVDVSGAAVRANQSREHFERSTFAGTIWPHHQRDLLCICLQRNVAEDRLASEALHDVVRGNHIWGAHAPSRAGDGASSSRNFSECCNPSH